MPEDGIEDTLFCLRMAECYKGLVVCLNVEHFLLAGPLEEGTFISYMGGIGLLVAFDCEFWACIDHFHITLLSLYNFFSDIIF